MVASLADRQHGLLALARNGDEAATMRLIKSLTGYIESAANRTRDREEARSVAILAILTAIREYRDDGGASFATYARRGIELRVNEMAWRDRPVPLPYRFASASRRDERFKPWIDQALRPAARVGPERCEVDVVDYVEPDDYDDYAPVIREKPEKKKRRRRKGGACVMRQLLLFEGAA
jgi:hypothetical protein